MQFGEAWRIAGSSPSGTSVTSTLDNYRFDIAVACW